MIKDNQQHFNRLHLIIDAFVIVVSYILRILAPAIIHTTPAVISNTFLFTPYFMFPFCIILLIQGTKIVKICS